MKRRKRKPLVPPFKPNRTLFRLGYPLADAYGNAGDKIWYDICWPFKALAARGGSMEVNGDIYGECGEPENGCVAHDENGFCAKLEADIVHQDKQNTSFHKFVSERKYIAIQKQKQHEESVRRQQSKTRRPKVLEEK